MPQQDTKFDYDKITDYVKEILVAAGLPVTHARTFVDLSMERKKRFHHMQFNSFGRREIPFTVTPQILLNDYRWFRQMLEEMGITKDALTVCMGKIFVLTARGGGAPLTKVLAKDADKLFAKGKHWFDFYEFADDVKGKPDVFLARLGDVINLGKKAVISINPGDILRKSMQGKYAAYTSCHNLRNGAYRQGPVSYALDPSHIITYITDGGDCNEKMHGRSMMIISNDLNVVAMRRFYPSPEVFGESRARVIREEVHKLIAPGVTWKKSKDTALLQPNTAMNGYTDPIAVATYADDSKKYTDVELCKDIFCFSCSKIHQDTSLLCPECKRKGVTQKAVR